MENFEGFDLNDPQNVLKVPIHNATLDDTGNRIGIAYYPLFASGLNLTLVLSVLGLLWFYS